METATPTGAAAAAWLIPLLPFLAFVVVSLFTRASGRLSALVSISALGGALALALAVLAQRLAAPDAPPSHFSLPWIQLAPEHPLGTISLGLLVDNLSAAMLAMVCLVGLCIQVYSLAYMEAEIGHFPTQGSASLSRFYTWLSLFTASMLALLLSDNLLQAYVFWELMGVCSYLLIGFWYFKESAARASKKAFLVTRFGDLGFLMGILMIGVSLESFDLLTLQSTFQEASPAALGGAALVLATLLLFCGAIGKSAQLPLQIWLPDAMEGPTPVSALIHAATMVAAGVFLVARAFPLYHPGGAPTEAAMFVALIGGLTALLAATIALVQNDIKRVLAYSTISQLGYMIAALGLGAYTAGSFHLITHAFFKALLFLGSGAVIVACHTHDMWRMGGLRRLTPITATTFLVGCLALAGFPGLSGFWSKDEILAGAWAAQGHGHPLGGALFAVLTLSGFLTAFYVTRMYLIAFEGSYRGDHPPLDLAGPIPPAGLPDPISPSRALESRPAWTEAQALSQGGLEPACLGAHMERAPHGHSLPHEVSPLMWVPLLLLSVFALGLGWIGVPGHLFGLDNHFEAFIHPGPSAPGAHHFELAPMALSIVAALGGIGLGWILFARDAAAGERRLRGLLGPAWTFLAQRWYLDHLWARLAGATLFPGALAAAWIDREVVDGAVARVVRVADRAGEGLREEHTGKVQHYALMILLALVVLAVGVGFLEPAFVTSRQSWLNLLTGGAR